MKCSHDGNRVVVERRGADRPFSVFPATRSGAPPLPALPAAGTARSEILPFKVRILDSEADLQRVQALREQAYGHHLPGLAAHFGQPDPVDRWPDVTIFFAEDKETGRMVGSARLQCNRGTPLQIQRSIELPDRFHGRHLAEVSRMVVLAGYAHPVKLAMVKALHLFCVASQIDGIVAASRPSLLRQYRSLGFSDLYGDERLAPMLHGGGLPHRILYRDVVTSEAYHREREHPDYGFVFRAFHPDIQIFNASPRRPGHEQDGSGLRVYSRAA